MHFSRSTPIASNKLKYNFNLKFKGKKHNHIVCNSTLCDCMSMLHFKYMRIEKTIAISCKSMLHLKYMKTKGGKKLHIPPLINCTTSRATTFSSSKEKQSGTSTQAAFTRIMNYNVCVFMLKLTPCKELTEINHICSYL